MDSIFLTSHPRVDGSEISPQACVSFRRSFEVDDANALRAFLLYYGRFDKDAAHARQAMALHTSFGIACEMTAPVALVAAAHAMFGSVNADVLERCDPAYRRSNYCDLIPGSRRDDADRTPD